jgi:hypothetical protein
MFLIMETLLSRIIATPISSRIDGRFARLVTQRKSKSFFRKTIVKKLLRAIPDAFLPPGKPERLENQARLRR